MHCRFELSIHKTDENGDLFGWSKVLDPQMMSIKLLTASGIPLPSDKTELVVQVRTCEKVCGSWIRTGLVPLQQVSVAQNRELAYRSFI